MASPSGINDAKYPEVGYEGTAPMQPVSLDEPVRPKYVEPKPWSAGLFTSVFAAPMTCITALFCPCIVFAQNRRDVNFDANHNNGTGADCLLYCCAVPCSACGCLGCLGASARSDIRSKYDIQGGNMVVDCLSHTFCTSCSLTADAVEISTHSKTA
ncbi:PLAC8 family-domain-containing protein [Entophlyctis helioformis]|nr:PLAC8 family-domain-containing protein [Entophlyctis helioformis]